MTSHLMYRTIVHSSAEVLKKQVSFSWGTIAKGDFHLGHRSILNANTNTNDFTDSPTKGFSELIYNCIKITIRLLKLR